MARGQGRPAARRLLPCAAALLALLAGACSGGDGDGGGGGDENLVVSLTDAPVDGVRAVNVTITAVRVHQSADAGTGDAGWRDLRVRAPMPVDLLRLRGGVLYELCKARLGAGHYQQVRLVVAENAGAGPPHRNSVQTADGRLHPLEVPSDIKIVHSFRVADGMRTDLRLDFRADDSLRQRGNGEYYLQPVVHASSTVR